MADHLNPVYDKEMRSELFGQGTLMLRLVIQLSMFLALPLMAVCLYMRPDWAAWYVNYVVLFNLLVGPVFSAGSITSERERQTLELLLTTTVSPWQILSGKLISGLRVSAVLTSFLVWPLLLAWLLPPWTYWGDTSTMLWYLAIIVVTSLTTTTLALFCSVIFRKTSVSMMTAYLVLVLLFAAPVAVKVFVDVLLPASPGAAAVSSSPSSPTAARGAAPARSTAAWSDPQTLIQRGTFTSPLAASFSLPLVAGQKENAPAGGLKWWAWTAPAFVGFYVALDALLLAAIVRLFNVRWRVRA
jgi:ABC-type transport system involved in multi-copper enzyme maturation permease subunit